LQRFRFKKSLICYLVPAKVSYAYPSYFYSPYPSIGRLPEKGGRDQML
jgi:hypothetical protein